MLVSRPSLSNWRAASRADTRVAQRGVDSIPGYCLALVSATVTDAAPERQVRFIERERTLLCGVLTERHIPPE